MKTLTIGRTALLIAGIVACLSLISCKKKDTTTGSTTVTTPANGTVMLHLHTNVDTNEVGAYNQIYVMGGGRKISVALAQLYISGIQLVKIDGTTYDVTGLNILKVMEVEEYLLGSVPAGNYKSIRFNVGLSASTNTTTPASNDSTLNRPLMWFGAMAQPSGYVFVNFQGKIDTSSAAHNTNAQMQSFSYKIGTNTHVKNVILPDKNYSVIPSQVQFIHITIDYSKLFNGITLNNAANLDVNTVSDNAGSLGNQVANNIPAMFRYEM
jgi:hypothetical protein